MFYGLIWVIWFYLFGYLVFGKIWAPPAPPLEDWQTPSDKLQNMENPSDKLQNLGTPLKASTPVIYS